MTADIAKIGDNNPPGPLDFAGELVARLDVFLKDNPVIQDEDASREAALHQRLAEACLKEIEAMRDAAVRPLNGQVKAINATHKTASAPLDRMLDTVKSRNTAFHVKQAREREIVAEAARKAAADAEHIAREAEAAERDAMANAAVGEVGVGLASLQADADGKFAELRRADQRLARAEKDKFRLNVGIGQTVSLKTRKVPKIADAYVLLGNVGVTPGIELALLTAARAYKATWGEFPAGVIEVEEVSL